VISSGNTAVAQRNHESGWTADVTGHTDFLDPIDHVAEVARHPPEKIIVLTDPNDQRVSSSVQTAYVEAAPGRRRGGPSLPAGIGQVSPRPATARNFGSLHLAGEK
jgi:hypothetical protein